MAAILGCVLAVSQVDAHQVRAASPTASLDVQVVPSGVGQGDFVVITGTSVIDSKAPKVKISITAPAQAGGSAQVISIVVPAAAATGLFQACYNQTRIPGTYRVLAQSGGGGAQGTTTFKVAAGFGPPNDAPVLGNLAVTFEHHIEGLVAALPTTPAKADLQDKLFELRARLATSLKEIQACWIPSSSTPRTAQLLRHCCCSWPSGRTRPRRKRQRCGRRWRKPQTRPAATTLLSWRPT